jgi:hypothetical protein
MPLDTVMAESLESQAVRAPPMADVTIRAEAADDLNRTAHRAGERQSRPADPDRDGRRLDDRVRGLSAAAPLRHRDRRPWGDHRLDDRRHWNVDAGLRLSASGDPKPDLDAGIFAYAKAGFNSALGYWASACAGNTSCWVLITATLSALVPGFGAGDTVLAVVVSAIGVWLFVFLVLRGVKDAAVINYIVTIAKVVPIPVFIVIAIIAFKADVFADNFWGGAEYSISSVWDQATGTMLITVFVFLGIEGASVYSRMHASERTSAGQPSSGF